MALGITNLQWPADKKVYATFSADSSYPNPSGYVVLASAFGLSSINRIDIPSTSGYVFFIDIPAGGASASIHVGEVPGGGGGGVTGATSAGTPAGTNASSPITGNANAQIFTGVALGSHSHSIGVGSVTVAVTPGTGVSDPIPGSPIAGAFGIYVTAGGVTGPATIIPSTATLASGQVQVNYTTGVLTFLIADAVTSTTLTTLTNNTTPSSAGTPAGTNAASSLMASADAQVFSGTPMATHTHTVGGGVTAGPMVETANGTDLSSLTGIKATIYGY